MLILFIAGMCITGAANAMNQALEKDTDAQMKRTANRPVAANRMEVTEAAVFSIIVCLIGFFFNVLFF